LEYETIIFGCGGGVWRASGGNECLIIRFGAGLYGNHCSTTIGPSREKKSNESE
jgi:hypothetical protein